MTANPTAEPTALDYLKYVAKFVRRRVDWTTDEIGGSGCDHGGHELQCGAISQLCGELDDVVALFDGDPNRYSDGRAVESGAWIENAVYVSHVWHPDPSQDKSRSWRGKLLHDPGTPCPGIYEVTTDPATQEIHVRVIRLVDAATQGDVW